MIKNSTLDEKTKRQMNKVAAPTLINGKARKNLDYLARMELRRRMREAGVDQLVIAQ